MELRTVSDLKDFLKLQQHSPEKFSAVCGISNMTIRRWLQKEESFKLPSKYWPILDQATGARSKLLDFMTLEFKGGFEPLEAYVTELGTRSPGVEELEQNTESKFSDHNVGQGLIDKVKLLFRFLKSENLTDYQRRLIQGALVYFITPTDLIPDVTPMIGYLDDYSVVTMVISALSTAFRKSPETLS